MAQHDFTIDNQAFPATRSDINSALQALASLSSGASSPSTTFAYQLWVNTTSDPNILNIRNSANNAWIEIGEVNQASAAFILTAYAYLQAGAAATPSHSFDDDRDTGMYRVAANIIGFATNGTERVRINDSGQSEFSSGTAALPSISTIGDVNTGIFFPAADTIAFVEGGAEAMRINSSAQVGIGTSTPTCVLDVTGGIQTSRTTVTSPAATDGNIFSGTYTPALTNTTNVASSTPTANQYMRVGNVVTVSGQVVIDPTTANTNTVLEMSLPIASTFASSRNCAGSGASMSTTIYASNGIAIIGNTTQNRAVFRLQPVGSGSETYTFSFTYLVI